MNHFPGVSAKRSSACRRLAFDDFAVKDSSHLILPSANLLNFHQIRDKKMVEKRWNFDFERDQPLENTDSSKFDWTRVPAADLPEFYSRPVHRKPQRPDQAIGGNLNSEGRSTSLTDFEQQSSTSTTSCAVRKLSFGVSQSKPSHSATTDLPESNISAEKSCDTESTPGKRSGEKDILELDLLPHKRARRGNKHDVRCRTSKSGGLRLADRRESSNADTDARSTSSSKP